MRWPRSIRLVLALVGLIAWLNSAATFAAIDWGKTLANLAIQLVLTIVFGIITEEGIFRGWLWASLQRTGVDEVRLFVLTAVAFAAWHVPDVLLPTDFRPPLAHSMSWQLASTGL